MRLFLIPISTRRAFVYCQSPQFRTIGVIDRITDKAAATWAKWERAEKGWKKQLVTYGHVILQRIPYEEWGLKSIPPLNTRQLIEESKRNNPIDVMFPGNAIKKDQVLGVLRTLGTERQELDRRKMWWCFGIAPLTAPIALIPVYDSNTRQSRSSADMMFCLEYLISLSFTLFTGVGRIGEVSSTA